MPKVAIIRKTGQQCQEPSPKPQPYEMPSRPDGQYARRVRKLKKRGFSIDFCSFAATHLIDGKRYCRHHAATQALYILEGDVGD